jgi:eukaryotic-like serine/threonine-protein kinase
MALSSGTKLGPYEIVAAAGAGGMGEVYRARDTRLDRIVAIKVLPSHLSSSAELKQRFEREAKAISSLNHPNICTLHDIGSQDGVDFLVMEYMEGQTLADRLAKGPLPLDQVLKIGTEVAEALEKAHRQGIVHRDLKPGNIMLTKSGAKLMDFGLAKPSSAAFAVAASPLAQSTPTMSVSNLAAPAAPLTQHGAVMGTYQYMAPEVLQGQESDARSDIFALGVVLYEMATGRHAFEGKTTASVIAAILEKDPPPISQTQAVAPPALDYCVRTCLAKNPEDRYETAHDVKLQLAWVQQATEIPAKSNDRGRFSARTLVLGFAAILALIAIGSFLVWSRWPTTPVLRSDILPPPDSDFSFSGDFSAPPAFSPDGKYIVFGARTKDGKRQLWLRPLNHETATPVEGTDGGSFPFWSPDSQSIGFFADGKLKRIAVTGGSPMALADAMNGRGGAWSTKGIVLFAPDFRGPVMQVSDNGGAVTEATQVDLTYHTTHRWPVFLPDQKHFLFFANNHTGGDPSHNGIYMGSLGEKGSRLVVATDAGPLYSDGYLLFHSGSSMMAQSMNDRGNLSGQPIQVVDNISNDVSVWRMTATVSNTGLLAFRSGGTAETGLELVWYDRSGKQIGKVGGRGVYRDPRISPDGRQLAVVADVGGNRGAATIYLVDLARGIQSRFTFDTASHVAPVWSADGKKIAYSAVEGNGNAGWSIFMKDVTSGGEPELVAASTGQGSKNAPQWSPDGKYMLYQEQDGPKGGHIEAMPLSGDGKPFVVAAPQSPTGTIFPGFQLSSDGRWVVYQCDDSGVNQIYVSPFPGPGGRVQVSNTSSGYPKWRADGKELYYLNVNTGYLLAVPVSTKGNEIQFGPPQNLFQYPFAAVGNFVYDVAADGKKFLLNTAVENEKLPFSLVTNWTAELKKK